MNLSKICILIFSLSLITSAAYTAQPVQQLSNDALISKLKDQTIQLEDSMHKVIRSYNDLEKLVLTEKNNDDSLFKPLGEARVLFASGQDLCMRATRENRSIPQQELNPINARIIELVKNIQAKIQNLGLEVVIVVTPQQQQRTTKLEITLNKNLLDSINTLNLLRSKFDTYLQQGIKAGILGNDILTTSDRNLVKELRMFFAITRSQLAVKQYELDLILAKLKPVLDILKKITETCLDSTNPQTQLTRLQESCDALFRGQKEAQEIIEQLLNVSREHAYIIRNLNTLFAVINGKEFHIPNQDKIERDLFRNIIHSNLCDAAFTEVMEGFKKLISADKQQKAPSQANNPAEAEPEKAQSRTWASWGVEKLVNVATWSKKGEALTKMATGNLPNLELLLQKMYPDQIKLAEQYLKQASQEEQTTNTLNPDDLLNPEAYKKARGAVDALAPEMATLVLDWFEKDELAQQVEPSNFDDYYTNAIIKTRNQDILLYAIAARMRFRTGPFGFLIKPLVKTAEEVTGFEYGNIMNILKDPSTPLSTPWKMFKMPPMLVRFMEHIICKAKPELEKQHVDARKELDQKNKQQQSQTTGTEKTELQQHSDQSHGFFGSLWKRASRLKDNIVIGTQNLLHRVLGKKRVNYATSKLAIIGTLGVNLLSKCRQLLAQGTLKVVRTCVPTAIGDLEQALAKGTKPSETLDKIQSFISDYELSMFRGPLSAFLKRNHERIRAIAEKYNNLQQIDPLNPSQPQEDPKKSKIVDYTIKDPNLREMVAQLSDGWFPTKTNKFGVQVPKKHKIRAKAIPPTLWNAHFQRVWQSDGELKAAAQDMAQEAITAAQAKAEKKAQEETKELGEDLSSYKNHLKPAHMYLRPFDKIVINSLNS